MGIRAPVKKIIKNDINTSKSKLENNIKKEKEFILEFDDEEDKNVSKKLTSISNNESNKREIKISFLSDDENEEDEKNHFKKFLEMKVNQIKLNQIKSNLLLLLLLFNIKLIFFFFLFSFFIYIYII